MQCNEHNISCHFHFLITWSKLIYQDRQSLLMYHTLHWWYYELLETLCQKITPTSSKIFVIYYLITIYNKRSPPWMKNVLHSPAQMWMKPTNGSSKRFLWFSICFSCIEILFIKAEAIKSVIGSSQSTNSGLIVLNIHPPRTRKNKWNRSHRFASYITLFLRINSQFLPLKWQTHT